MKKQLHTFIMGSLALFSIYLYTLSAAPLSTRLQIKEIPYMNVSLEEQNALNYLNSLRMGSGLIPFQSQIQLNKAAQNHANYLTENFTFGHKEEQNRKGFTGEFASARVKYAGYATSQVIENVSTHNQSYKESINGLFAAIYHRLAFLDFRSDAIGIGIRQNPYKRSQTAFVYDMSSKTLENLYKYKQPVTSEKIKKALNYNKGLNSDVVIYPFDQQQEVPPAFFDELPDPLPQHKVSGFPISISFNSLYHKEARLLNFQIFDAEGREVRNTLIFDHKTDPNKRLEKLDFVLFPLERLQWNSQYHVIFSAILDNQPIHKEWSFKTQSFSAPLHVVHKDNMLYKLKTSETHIFYFPPSSKVDLLRDVVFPKNIDIAFVDKNTIRLTALVASSKQIIKIGNHKIKIKIEEL